MGRYRHRPLHLFGGIGLLMGAVGFIVLLYLTVLWFWGEGIGTTAAPHARRPPRWSSASSSSRSGCSPSSITSQHEERIDERERTERMVEDVLR